MDTTYQIEIWPAVKESWRGLNRELPVFVQLAWPYLVLLALTGVIPFDLSGTADYLMWLFLRALLPAFFLVGFYRHFLLGGTGNALHRLVLQRGENEKKTILAIPFYFDLSWRPFVFAFLFFALALIFLSMRDEILDALRMEYAGSEAQIVPGHLIVVTFYGLMLAQGIIIAWLALIWPHVAVGSDMSTGKLKELPALLRGNVLRVFIVGFLLFLPYFLYQQLPLILALSVDSLSPGFLAEHTWLWAFFQGGGTVVYYFCTGAAGVFVSRLYSRLAMQEELVI